MYFVRINYVTWKIRLKTCRHGHYVAQRQVPFIENAIQIAVTWCVAMECLWSTNTIWINEYWINPRNCRILKAGENSLIGLLFLSKLFWRPLLLRGWALEPAIPKSIHSLFRVWVVHVFVNIPWLFWHRRNYSEKIMNVKYYLFILNR